MIGSVLHKGSSSKDLDIVVYPRKVKDTVPEGLVSCVHAVLRQHGMTLMADRARVLKTWAKRGEGGGDEKWVEVWAIDNKRVDVFILS
jgi:hypothetical protein